MKNYTIHLGLARIRACPYTGFISQHKAVHKDHFGNKISKGQIYRHTTYEGED